jgi:hypothetical protein
VLRRGRGSFGRVRSSGEGRLQTDGQSRSAICPLDVRTRGTKRGEQGDCGVGQIPLTSSCLDEKPTREDGGRLW